MFSRRLYSVRTSVFAWYMTFRCDLWTMRWRLWPTCRHVYGMCPQDMGNTRGCVLFGSTTCPYVWNTCAICSHWMPISDSSVLGVGLGSDNGTNSVLGRVARRERLVMPPGRPIASRLNRFRHKDRARLARSLFFRSGRQHQVQSHQATQNRL